MFDSEKMGKREKRSHGETVCPRRCPGPPCGSISPPGWWPVGGVGCGDWSPPLPGPLLRINPSPSSQMGAGGKSVQPCSARGRCSPPALAVAAHLLGLLPHTWPPSLRHVSPRPSTEPRPRSPWATLRFVQSEVRLHGGCLWFGVFRGYF